MALRTILKKDTDEESLRKKSRPVTVFDQRLHNMIDDMVDTLKDSIEKEDGTILELVNPEIIDTQGEQEGLEGCLSLPGIWGVVKRPMTVTVKAMDRNGNVFTDTDSGLIGRCFVHECEHLDGILFVDRASKILTEEDLQRMEEEGEPEPGSEGE